MKINAVPSSFRFRMNANNSLRSLFVSAVVGSSRMISFAPPCMARMIFSFLASIELRFLTISVGSMFSPYSTSSFFAVSFIVFQSISPAFAFGSIPTKIFSATVRSGKEFSCCGTSRIPSFCRLKIFRF